MADTHTTLVGWLKVALPLTALALLSTLFLLADRIDPGAAIPYAEVDVEDLARDPRMTAPTYAGTTADGAALTITARAARPASGTRPAAAIDVRAVLDLADGSQAQATAGEAQVDTTAGLLTMTEGVQITTSSGWRVDTSALTARLDRTGAESGGPVTAAGPAGSVDASGFTLTLGADNTTLLVFTGQVKLLYLPGSPSDAIDP